ncbi:MAG TPA: hypothetical protein VJG90_06740 [Candidatus Nanoarchaeia archaeon]|nr:hypothetical protein [Candidatus Nanoarchaeia archaeon]
MKKDLNRRLQKDLIKLAKETLLIFLIVGIVAITAIATNFMTENNPGNIGGQASLKHTPSSTQRTLATQEYIQTSCTDTDGGIVLRTQGTVNPPIGPTGTDWCNTFQFAPILREYFCDSCNNTNESNAHWFNCLAYGFTGCSNGACTPSTVPEPILSDFCKCGDQVIDPGEQCDDGTSDPLTPIDRCANCLLTFCGDGLRQLPNGRLTGGPLNDGYESCDDGNMNSLDGCTTNCLIHNNSTNSTQGCGTAANCSVTCPPSWSCVGSTQNGCGGKCIPPLSVHWDYYKATCKAKDKILIEWRTTDEKDTFGFIVQWANNQLGPFTDASPGIPAMGPYNPYQWLDTTTDVSPFSPQNGILNWYNIRELCASPPPFCSQTGSFTTQEICQDETPETPKCGGIAGLQCPEGYQCVCPEPKEGTSDELCTCEPL